ETAIGVLVRQAVQHAVLARRATSAGQAHPQHERVGLLQTRLAAGRPLVAIVLQVETMKLGQLRVALADGPRGRIPEVLRNRSPQETALSLEDLVCTKRLGQGWIGSHNDRRSNLAPKNVVRKY